MDLIARLRRAAYTRPHLLLVTAPGATRTRLAVELHARRSGLPLAAAPADADVLVEVGTLRGGLAAAADGVYAQIPAPAVRVAVPDADDVPGALGDLPALVTGAIGAHREHGEAVAGLPMADRAPDRDGLMLDQLHVPVGPVLPAWPAGLRLRLALQGDVVQEVTVEPVGTGGGEQFWTDPARRALAGEPVAVAELGARRAAAHLDSISRLLAVAGWDWAALCAVRLRDAALHARGSDLLGEFRVFHRRVRRSRLLPAMTNGLGELGPATADRYGITGPARRAGGDVTARLRQWLAETEQALTEVASGLGGERAREGPRGELGDDPPSRGLLDALPHLLAGTELAAARLIVASLDPDLDELPEPADAPPHAGPVPAGHHHG